MYQETFIDFLCKLALTSLRTIGFIDILLLSATVGGWLGLAIGASAISFIELVYFCIVLGRKMLL